MSHRTQTLRRFEAGAQWDVVMIGGGATGLGIALDAAQRGFSVALVEARDFASGTSSRATKLLHGGVRYLAQGNLALVRDALRERTVIMGNAPHLAQPLPFVLPLYGLRGALFDRWFYRIGLGLYDRLAGEAALRRTDTLDAPAAHSCIPALKTQGLSAAVRYWDGQFEDARLALALARTAINHGAAVLNHCRAVEILREGGRITGIVAEDVETRRRLRLQGRCVINATGVWVDAIRHLDASGEADLVVPSRGTHLVVDRSFLQGDHAVLLPRTADGRVLFAIPWLGRVLLGTTDVAASSAPAEPEADSAEVDFILREAGSVLARAPQRHDVRSVWSGLRPLVKPAATSGAATKSVSREHLVHVDRSGLVSVTGGKWTTYRSMAEDVLQRCVEARLLASWPAGGTAALRLQGWIARSASITGAPGLHLYGADAPHVAMLPGSKSELAPGLTEAMVRFAAREEHARSVEDVLARRSRLLFLDAALAGKLAPRVAQIMEEELGAVFDAQASCRAFEELAARYSFVPQP